jgi:hypothetical protein
LKSIEGNIALIAAVVFAALSAAEPAGATSVSSCSRRHEVFCSETHAVQILHLAHRQIIAFSESVYVDGAPAEKGLQYEIDYARGIVSVPGGLQPGSCLEISYRMFPYLFKGDYSLRKLEPVTRDAPRPAGLSDGGEAIALRSESGRGLRASGSKTVAVEAGSLGGVKVDQSLSLSIGGNIGGSVNVVGVLSDKDFGFDQGSQTQRLKDLDKVFLEVTSPEASARVGDIEIAEAPGDLLKFERSLTGFYASASRGESGIRASAASTRTMTESALLEGREGISGPYVVTDADGRPVAIVPNSEKVWLDGIPMQRGKGMDYTVDYQAGAVYFSPSRFIRESSRIVVDYEVQDREGGRQLYFAGSDLVLSENAALGFTVVNERFSPALLEDDGSAGAGGVSLGSAGEAGWREGGHYVGPGQGDYVRGELDSLHFYQYVGDFAGDYEVTFSKVGDGEGDYEYVFSEAWQKYIYVYAGAGDYVAMIAPSPELSSQVVHMKARGSVGDMLEVRGEGALSKSGERADGGDWVNASDGAYAVTVRGQGDLPDIGGRDAGGLAVEVNRRSVGAGFHTFGRIRDPGFVETWGMKPSSVYEETDGLKLGYSLEGILSADAGVGRMATDAGSSLRRQASVAVGQRNLGLTAMADAVDVDGEAGARGIRRRGIDLRAPVKFVNLNLGNRYEERNLGDDLGSFRRNEIYSEVRLPGADRYVSMKLGRTSESRIVDSAWDDYSTVTEGRIEFEAGKGSLLQVRGVLGQSRVDYAERVGLGDLTSTACDLAVSLRDLGPLSAVTLDYGLASTLTTLYETEVVKVGPGGDCDSLGNYVEGGEYTLSRREAGRAPVTRLKSRFLMETGRSGKVLHKRRLTTRTEVAVEGESVDENLRRAALPGYGDLIYSESMLAGRVTASEQVVLNRIGENTISAYVRGTRGQDRRTADRLEQIAQDQAQVRLISNSFDNMTLSVEGEVRSNRRSIGTGPQAVDRNISGRSVRMEVEKPVLQGLRAMIAVAVLKEKSTVPLYDVTEADLSPGLTLFAGSLRCDARVNMRRMLSGSVSTLAGYTKQNSLDWNARVSFNHTRYTSLSVEYTGRTFEHSPPVHNVRASVNATF